MTKSIGWVWQYTNGTFEEDKYPSKEDCKEAAKYWTIEETKGKPVQVMLVPERLPESELDALMSSTDLELQLMAKAFYRLAENHILGETK